MINEATLLQERRNEIRFGLTGLIPLRLEQEGSPIDALFLDSSKRGLGIVVEPVLKVDQLLTLNIGGGHQLQVSVRWVKKPVGFSGPGIPAFHRAGLLLTDTKVNLLEYLENFYCVDH